MKEFEYVITDEIGIHARPAGLLAKEAKKYESTVTLIKEDKKATADRLMTVMGMGIKCGDTIRIRVEGSDEEEACEAIQKFFEENL